MTYYKIAVLGGTGPQGRGLAYRFAQAGHTVTVGSRRAERAESTANEIAERLGSAPFVSGTDNASAVSGADVVILAVPYEGHGELVASLSHELDDKVVVSCVNPLGFDKRGAYGLDVANGSAAEEAARLAPGARIVGAFHHLSAVNLWTTDALLDHEDVLVCGDDVDTKRVAITLCRAIVGRDGIDAGALRLARQLEPLTAVLININKTYKIRSGIRISGMSHV